MIAMISLFRTKLFSTLALLLLVAFSIAGCSDSPVQQKVDPNVELTGETKDLFIEGKNWEFSQSDVQIRKGDRVRLHLKSSVGSHGLALPAFGVATGATSQYTKNEEIIEFIADKAGKFEYYCNVPCGSGHRDMKGILKILE